MRLWAHFWWSFGSLIYFCTLGGDALPPAALGDALINAANGLQTMKVTDAWKRLTDTVSTSIALKHTLRRLQILPSKAAHVVHTLVDRIRVGEGPVVKTALGSLRGRYLVANTRSEKEYYSFRGVRYAQPPIGKLRFRAPEPVDAWKGTRDAIEEGSMCPQKFLIFDNYKGDEDCLFLNVYTPQLPDKMNGYNPKLPVMVWLHGGGFMTGSGNSFLYGPDYLMNEDVVLVTLNYRLGALGFLSLHNDEVPGNAGLKDQLMALKWVKENIEFFGGDPNRVTIFGESAGGASVHLLMLSPAAKGYFHQAISQSGTALNTWAFVTDPLERAFSLGKVLGIETNSTAELLGYLRATPSETLVQATQKIITKEDLRQNIGIPFVPAIEPTNLSAETQVLLTDDARKILAEGKVANPVPHIVGFNSEEAMIFFRRLRKDPTLLDQINGDFERMIPNDLHVPGGKDGEEGHRVAAQIRSFYFGNETISIENVGKMVDLLTDTMFARPALATVRLEKLFTPKMPVYMYRFSFDGALGIFKRLMGITFPGACHGDEMGYLFHFGRLNLRLDESSPEFYVQRRMVKMWANFAKKGNPTPKGETLPSNLVWIPVTDLDNIPYLEISSNFTMKSQPEKERNLLWDELFTRYNGHNWY